MNTRMRGREAAFTLVEILVVISILTVLSGIVFTVIRNAQESARSTTCLSNARQLGLAMNLYSNDSDDRTPGSSAYFLGANFSFRVSLGWAGKEYPYVRQASSFACPDDGAQMDPAITLEGSQRVSYAANENGLSKTLTEIPGARTVLLFEVTNSFALISKVDEGMSPRPSKPEKVSAVGNGIKGDLIDSFIVPALVNAQQDIAYATGRLSNSENDEFHDDFLDSGRHRDGANYLLIDGHAGWASPGAVSAGADAHSPTASQSSTGCFIAPSTHGTELPCAEGASASAHKFTFSST